MITTVKPRLYDRVTDLGGTEGTVRDISTVRNETVYLVRVTRPAPGDPAGIRFTDELWSYEVIASVRS